VIFLIRPPWAPFMLIGISSPGTKAAVERAVYPVPFEMLSRSTVPPAVMARATSSSSPMLMPPEGSPWSAVIRKPTRKSSEVQLRTDWRTSRPKRTRFSSEPPYRSVRVFTLGSKNCSMRCPP
jgi:hypothetical protein